MCFFNEESADHTTQNGTNPICTRSSPNFMVGSRVLLLLSLVVKYPQLNDFMSNYRKQGEFELQVFDRLLKKFDRHHFKVPK